MQKEAPEDGTAKHSSTLETAVSRSTKADPESVNEGLPDKICDQFSDVVLDACLTCDTRCKVACETCVKDNMFMVAGEISVAGKCHHETVVRGVARDVGIDSFIDDSSRVASKGLQYQDCEVLFHVNRQSPCIAGGVDVGKNDPDDGAGDQGMFEYASNETDDAVFLTHQMATRMRKKSSDVYNNGDPWWFRAHGKTQVTIEHVEGTDESLYPKKIYTVVTHATAAATQEQETQLSTIQQTVGVPQVQHQHSNQVTQEKTEEREAERKGERERKEKGREGEEEGDKEDKKVVMG